MKLRKQRVDSNQVNAPCLGEYLGMGLNEKRNAPPLRDYFRYI